MAHFINPFTDIGFKTIFGQEMTKDLLIDFLNNLLVDEKKMCNLLAKSNNRSKRNENLNSINSQNISDVISECKQAFAESRKAIFNKQMTYNKPNEHV